MPVTARQELVLPAAAQTIFWLTVISSASFNWPVSQLVAHVVAKADCERSAATVRCVDVSVLLPSEIHSSVFRPIAESDTGNLPVGVSRRSDRYAWKATALDDFPCYISVPILHRAPTPYPAAKACRIGVATRPDVHCPTDERTGRR